MPNGAFNICCPRDCVSRHNGGTSGAPLKPLRDDSAPRALSFQEVCKGAQIHFYFSKYTLFISYIYMFFFFRSQFLLQASEVSGVPINKRASEVSGVPIQNQIQNQISKLKFNNSKINTYRAERES